MNALLRNRQILAPFCFVGYQYSSWSPLGLAFNKRQPQVMRKCDKKGLFDVPELTEPGGFHILKEQCINNAEAMMKEASLANRSRKMVNIFDDLSDTLCKVADMADFIRIAHPSKLYAEAAEAACGAVSGLVEKLNTNKELYDGLKHVVSNGDREATTKIDDHVAKLFLFDFEQSGIHLAESSRNHVVHLNDEILSLGHQFVTQAANPRIIPEKCVPAQLHTLFPTEGESLIVTGLFPDSPNPLLREFAYRIYLYPEKAQEVLLERLLRSRHELARICGFQNYAERALRGSMLETPQMVFDFLSELSANLKGKAIGDLHVLNELKKQENPHSGPLAPWDVPYFTQKYKKAVFNVSSSEYSPYFSLGACMEGLNIIFTRLYGVRLENTATGEGEVWFEDVYKLAVIHESEGLLGYIYCDFYEREGKPNQDCHFTIRGGRQLGGDGYQLPVVVLMLNLPVPRWSNPTLLTPGMVDNLFHEMGHAMHSMLGRTRYQHVTGTRCSTDIAEVPSVLMEYYAKDPRVLKTFARHFQTHEMMPDSMIERLCASKHALTASEMQIQLFYSMLDHHYHSAFPLKGTTTEALAEIQNSYHSLAYVEHTAWQLRFSHLVGYGAKYYSYLVSTALASWIWHKYFEVDPLNRREGERYRREFLAHGGGKPPWSLISDFLQREPTPSRLVSSLITELDSKHERLAN